MKTPNQLIGETLSNALLRIPALADAMVAWIASGMAVDEALNASITEAILLGLFGLNAVGRRGRVLMCRHLAVLQSQARCSCRCRDLFVPGTNPNGSFPGVSSS